MVTDGSKIHNSMVTAVILGSCNVGIFKKTEIFSITLALVLNRDDKVLTVENDALKVIVNVGQERYDRILLGETYKLEEFSTTA